MKKWIRNKIVKWLGVDSLNRQVTELRSSYENIVSIGVDVHFKSPHMILIYSNFNGGSIHHIEADFKDPQELKDFISVLKNKYRTDCVTWDIPRGSEHIFNTRRERA